MGVRMNTLLQRKDLTLFHEDLEPLGIVPELLLAARIRFDSEQKARNHSRGQKEKAIAQSAKQRTMAFSF
jgi:hypothetical protein